MKRVTIETSTARETRLVGEVLGRNARGGQVVALHGELGAGKTTLVQGLAAGMGVQARVTSPTFVLVNDYTAGHDLHLVHVDTYRLGNSISEAVDDAATFGLDSLLDDSDAVVAIEWAERVAPLLPADHLRVSLSVVESSPDGRIICLGASGPQSEALLAALTAHMTANEKPVSGQQASMRCCDSSCVQSSDDSRQGESGR